MNKGNMYVAKNRNGPDGILFPIKMDTSNVKIKVMPMGIAGNTVAPTVKTQSESLRSKYKRL